MNTEGEIGFLLSLNFAYQVPIWVLDTVFPKVKGPVERNEDPRV